MDSLDLRRRRSPGWAFRPRSATRLAWGHRLALSSGSCACLQGGLACLDRRSGPGAGGRSNVGKRCIASRQGRPQNEKRGALFYELIEIIFCYAELLENLIKKPASDLAIAMNWDCSCPAIWMLPSGMASLLPYHLEAQLSGNLLQVSSFGRHKQPLHRYPLEAFALLLRALHLSYRRR